MNRHLIAILLLPLSVLACSLTNVSSRSQLTVADGEKFELEEGDKAVLFENGTRLTFVEVVADSRCPAEADCVTAGEVTIRVELREDAGTTQHDLTLRAGDEYVKADGHFATVLLYAVDPYPSIENAPNEPNIATFVILGPECCAPAP